MDYGATAMKVFPIGFPRGCTVIVCSADNAASNSLMEKWNVGLIVKCSGNSKGMKPAAYGRNRGSEVKLIYFTVNHRPTVQGKLQVLLKQMETVFGGGQAVLFHCNKGIHRAPAGFAIAMAHLNHSSIKAELDGLRLRRPEIYHIYEHCFDEGYSIDEHCTERDRNIVQTLRDLDAEIPGRSVSPPNCDSNGNRNWDRDGHSNGNRNWDWYWFWHSNSCGWHWASNGNWNSSWDADGQWVWVPSQGLPRWTGVV